MQGRFHTRLRRRMALITHTFRRSLRGSIVILGLFYFVVVRLAVANVQEEISQRNAQIAEIQRQIAEYEEQIRINQGKAKTLSSEISGLNARINKIQLEINSLTL